MSQALYISLSNFSNFNLISLYKKLKKKNQKIIRYCFHKKSKKTNQIMLILRKKNSYKILEITKGNMIVLILKGSMKLSFSKKKIILKRNQFFFIKKGQSFANEIISNECLYIEFSERIHKVIKRF
jgi:hypothetical protein